MVRLDAPYEAGIEALASIPDIDPWRFFIINF